jgi:hypothetical protein
VCARFILGMMSFLAQELRGSVIQSPRDAASLATLSTRGDAARCGTGAPTCRPGLSATNRSTTHLADPVVGRRVLVRCH